MKKNFKYAFMSAIAFAGAVGFSACSSSDEIVDNPDYNPETNSVKTTITLSINPNNGSMTRQTGTVVQNSGFLGIGNILSIPSASDIDKTTSTANKLSWGEITAFDNSSSNYKLYANQDIAVGVNHFLFIGKSKGDANNPTKLQNGSTTNNLSNLTSTATVGDIQINADAIVSSDDITTSNSSTKNWKYISNEIASYLTNIANVDGWSTTSNASLKSYYQEFTRTGGSSSTIYNAGSAESVRLLLQDLYNKISGISDATVTNIKTAIETQVDVSGTAAPYALAWNSTCDFSSFPKNFDLPEGSAQYKWNSSSSAFEYITDNTLNAVSTPLANFVYPNELYYLTKTPLRATSSANVNWPDNVSKWTNEVWTSWTSDVQATSRNIALKYNINYGSALLATTIQAEATTLYDNALNLDPAKIGVSGEKNNAITISGSEFELTGVLVGSQPSAVGWNFLPVSTTNSNSSTAATFANVVYDGTMPSTINVTTTASSPNYTLVFDDYKATPADVNICLEFKNNMTTSFYGKDGIILPGQTFYIVGKLDVTHATNPIPANSTPNTDDELDTFYPSRDLRAFIQDYTTTANFILKAGTDTGNGDGSLAKAVTTVPDLRESSQTIGLSVDLAWKAGVTYTVNLGE